VAGGGGEGGEPSERNSKPRRNRPGEGDAARSSRSKKNVQPAANDAKVSVKRAASKKESRGKPRSASSPSRKVRR